MEVGRRPAACLPPLFLSPSLPATLPPSLPRRRIQLTSPQGNVSRRSCSLPVSLTLPSRRRQGTSSHFKIDRRSCSTSPSLPPSLLLSLPPSPSLPVPPFLPCRRRQGTSIHTKVDRRSRAQEAPWNGNEAVVLPKALCLWHKMSLAQTVSGTNCLWHKQSLAQTVSGTNCLWRKLTSNTKISRQPRSSLNALSLSRIKVCKYIPGNQFI